MVFKISSSVTVYGFPDELLITEKSCTKRPTSPYGNIKKVGDEIMGDFTVISINFKSIYLICFNPIGAYESGELGETPSGTPNNLLPFITQTAKGKRKELKILEIIITLQMVQLFEIIFM